MMIYDGNTVMTQRKTLIIWFAAKCNKRSKVEHEINDTPKLK